MKRLLRLLLQPLAARRLRECNRLMVTVYGQSGCQAPIEHYPRWAR